MSAEDDDQLAPEQAFWDEGFRRNIFNAEWPTTVLPSAATPYPPNAPMTPEFTDGRMAVSVFPPFPAQENPPMTSYLVPSNDPMTAQCAVVSASLMSAHDTALRFQSQVIPTCPWSEEYLQSPHFDLSPCCGYLPPTSSSAPKEMMTDTLPIISMPGTDLPYTTHYTPNPWEVLPISQPPSLRPSRPSGPERSRKSVSQRTGPFTARPGEKGRHAKRAAACWRCRKYRKPVSKLSLKTLGNY